DAGLHGVDGEKARARGRAFFVDRLDHEELVPVVRRMMNRAHHGAQHAAELHAISSTIPTMAASTGTNQGSSASAASRAEPHHPTSPVPACTVSHATCESPAGLCA